MQPMNDSCNELLHGLFVPQINLSCSMNAILRFEEFRTLKPPKEWSESLHLSFILLFEEENPQTSVEAES